MPQDKPKIKAREFEGKLWITLDDHKADVQRYKDFINKQPQGFNQLADIFFNGGKKGGKP